MTLIILAILALVALDLYLSHQRMTKYGPLVELNPVARILARQQGIQASLAFLLLWNLALVAVLSKFPVLMHMLLGAKLGLAAMQIRSLETENYIETILKAVKKKNG